MGCSINKINTVRPSTDSLLDYNGIDDDNTVILDQHREDNYIPIVEADSDAFNSSFIQERQQAIENQSYRSAIDSCKPKSLQQLTDIFQTFSKGKSVVDSYWIVFYWIIHNIQYDSGAHISERHDNQSPENVFQKRRGLSLGYANLYKYLCDQLQISCQIINGNAKGYKFYNCSDVSNQIDHTWNAAQINHHWYLIETSWGAGYLTEQNTFQHEPNMYYFFPRPSEMIYHHLPIDDKWQLLKTPINMERYLQMPHLHPLFFNLNIELVSPCNMYNLSLLTDKPYALVVLKTPENVFLTADLKLRDKNIDGGTFILFDTRQKFYRCYFAPVHFGTHKIHLYAKKGNSTAGEYRSILDFALDVKQMPSNPISFPKILNNSSEFNLQIISPRNTYLIKLNNGETHAEILIKVADNVELRGILQNERKQVIVGGEQVFYDQEKRRWCCRFAPDRNGRFEAFIMAKRTTESDGNTLVVNFKIEAKHISSTPISYPLTWQHFHDLNLQIIVPRNCSSITWSDDVPYVEVLMRAPKDIQLSCDIKYNQFIVTNGSLAQFNHEKQLWQLLFAPEQVGQHELIVYAKKSKDLASPSCEVVKFNLIVRKLRRPMKFPTVYSKFQMEKCQIHTPINGVLMKGSLLLIHCIIPGAKSVMLTLDSRVLTNEGYKDPILHRQIQTGSKEVIVYAKYGQSASFDSLIKYIIQ